jgi:hypothetical protein
MSARPQREVKPIRTLANNQARNVAEAAARAAATPKTVRRAVRPTKTARPNNVNNGSLPRGKDKLIPRLKLLISQVTNDRDLQNFLISMYDETANDKYTVDLFGGKTEEEAKRKIGVHVDLFSKELYRGSTPQMSFNIKGDDMINLAYLMYLDMQHDTTIPKSMKFETFCGETITVSVKVPAPTAGNKKATKTVKKTQKSPVYILFGKGLEAKETEYIKTINAFIVSEGKAEIAVKNNLPSIYPKFLDRDVTIRMDQVTPNILTPGHNMFLSIDQEDEKATVTLDIQKTKYNLPGGGTAKIMYPLVSVANLMDPGKNMLIESAKEDSKYFMLGLNNRDIRSRLTWNYKEPKFTINHDNGSTTIGAYYTDAARVTNKNRKTKRGYAYIIKNNKGEYRFTSNISKAKAKDGSTDEKVAKFLGDFLQALTVVSYVKDNKNPKYHYCLATGDAMLANNFVFLCSRSGVSPNLWMATSTQQVSKVYGKMIDNIQTVQPAPTQVRNAPNVSNGNQVVSSGNNRTEGSGNTINKRNTRKSPNVNEGTGESNGNRGNNRNRALAGMLGRVAPKPTPIQIRNSNSNSNNNMNNANRPLAGMLGRMGPSQGQKRKRENNKNKNNNAQSGVGSRYSIAGNNKNGNVSSGNSQPNAKKPKINVNVAQRNRLINNLKNKGLSKNVINRFIKNYNTGTKGVNQILQEVKTKANAKREQNAKNAAALRQLKKLRPELF